MWDLAGLELTGCYVTWSERSYELVDVESNEVTEAHSTIVQGRIARVFVDVLAQRQDGSWAVSAEDPDGGFTVFLGRLGLVPTGSTWAGWVPEGTVEITGRVSYVCRGI